MNLDQERLEEVCANDCKATRRSMTKLILTVLKGQTHGK